MDLFLPFNAVDHDRVHTAEDIAELFASVMTDGVHPNPGSSLFVSSAGGWNVSIAPGKCVIQGRLGMNRVARMMTVDAPSGTFDRVDSVVLRCDFGRREIFEVIKKGVSAANPVAAALQRDADAWELCIARVRVGKAAAAIAQAAITDTRQDGAVCGVINSLIRVDAATLFRQYEDAWNTFFTSETQGASTWRQGQQAAFETWFAGIQNILQGDVAARLASDLQSVSGKVSGCVYEVARFDTTVAVAAWTQGTDRWSATVTNAAFAASGVDVDVIAKPASLAAPLCGVGTPGNGMVTLYAYRKPDAPVEITCILKGVRA